MLVGYCLQGISQVDPLTDIIAIPFSSSSDDEFLSTAIDPADSSIYSVGFVSSNQALGQTMSVPQGNRDGVIAKYNSQGTLEWYVYVGGAENDYISDIAVHANGDISITGQVEEQGYFSSANGGAGLSVLAIGKKHQSFVARYSSTGQVKWAKGYGGTENDVGIQLVTIGDNTYTAIAFDNINDDVAIGGEAVPNTSLLPLPNGSGLGSTTSFALLAHNSTGDLLWKSYFGSNRDDIDLSNLNIDNPYNLLVAGLTVQDNRLYVTSMYSRTQSLYNANNNRYALGAMGTNTDDDIMFMEYDLDGTPLWQTSIWIDGGQHSKYLNIASDCNGLYISATLNGSVGIYPNATNRYVTGSGYDPVIFKADLDDGTIAWHQELVTPNNNFANDYIGGLSTDGKGNLLIIGGFYQSLTCNNNFTGLSETINAIEDFDMFLGVMDVSDGYMRYLAPLGNEGYDYGQGIDTQAGLISLIGTGMHEDEFDNSAYSFNTNTNLALAISINDICPSALACAVSPSLSAGTIIADSGPYCINQDIQFELTGNTEDPDWVTHDGSTWNTVASDTSSLLYTATANVKMHAIVHDACGRADTTEYLIEISNNPPTAICKSSHTLMLDNTGNGSLVVTDLDNGSTDDCGIITYTLTQSDFDCDYLGDQLIELTVEDEMGNTASCTTTVEVRDSIAPEVTCPSDFSLSIPDGSCSTQGLGMTPASLSDNCNSFTVSYGITGVTNTSGFDDASGTLFNKGVSDVTYTINDGSNSDNCTFQVTVTDTPLAIIISDASADEDQSSIDFTISLDHSICQDITIEYQTADISASDGSDYTGTNIGTVNIPAGDTIATVFIMLTDDLSYEGDEQMTVTLTSTSYGSFDDNNAVGTILENDDPPSLSIQQDYSVYEGDGTLTVDIELSESASLGVSFEIYSINGTAGNDDYEEIPSGITLFIPAGQTQVTLELDIDDDSLYEGNEDFKLQLANPINATLSAANYSDVVITDNEVPLIIAAWTDFSSACGVDQSQLGSDISGGCGDYIITRDSSFVVDCGATGTWTYTHTVEDACGVIISDTQQATTQDQMAPTITVGNDTTLNCGSALPTAIAIVSDDCNSVLWTYEDETNSICGNTNEVIRTFTAEDACGLTSTTSRTFTYTDTIPPTISVAANDTIECGANKPTPFASVSDECGAADWTYTETFISLCGEAGTWTRIYTATDDCDNSAIATQTITVQDTTAPSISGTTNQTIECGLELPVAAATVIDSCDPSPTLEISETYTEGCGDTRTYTRVYTATDICDNSAVASQIITVVDTTAPSITGTGDQTIECGVALPTAAATVEDTCDSNPTLEISETYTEGCGDTRVYTRVYTATDDCGNSSQATETISVVDSTPPVISVADSTIECGETLPTPDATATDGCGDVTLTYTETFAEGCANTGTYTRIYTAADECDNSVTATQIITIQDNTPPTINIVGDTYIGLECGEEIPSANATAVDGCGAVTLTDTMTFASGCGATGVYTRIYTATDACDNTATASQTITFTDSTAPTFEINPDALVECGSEYEVVGSSDWMDCSMPLVMLIDTLATTDTDGAYALDVEYTLTDHCGNSSAQNQLITFQDVTAPIAIAQNISLPLNAQGYTVVMASEINNGSSEECSSITPSIDIDTLFAIGDYPVILTVTDEAGNLSSDQAIVTVYDDIAPDAICQDVTIYLDINGQAQIIPADIDLGSNDNSGNVTLGLYLSDFDCSHVGSPVQDTLYVSDGTQTDYCLTNVSVLDTIAPTIVCPSTLTLSKENTGGDVFLEIPVPFFTENCDGAILVNDYNNTANASADYPFGETEITWSISNNNQEASCSTIIELIEYIEPAIDCTPTLTAVASEDACGLDLTLELPITAGILNLENNYGQNGAAAFFPVGETIVTWYTLDPGLEELQCTTSVTVSDVTPPTISCLGDTIHCGLNLSLPLPIVSDNCETNFTYSINGIDNATMEFMHEIPSDVTWTVIDGSNSAECITTVTAHDNSIPAQVGANQDLNAIYETTIDALMQSEGVGYWTFIEGDGIISDSQSNITTVSQLQSGTNVLLWIVESEVCGFTMDEITLHVRDFLIPTAFSPNGDGFNDEYRIIGINTIPDNEFSVYSRWGELVYSAKNYTNDWAGRGPLGKLLPPDTYYFILDVKGPNAEAYKGSIELRY